MTKDSVTVTVDGVVYYKIENPLDAIVKVNNYGMSTRLLASTTLRTILGTKNLSEILGERKNQVMDRHGTHLELSGWFMDGRKVAK